MTSSFTNDSIPNDEIPVLLTIFNRPDKTKVVIDNLRQIRPKRIFVAADGPRDDYAQDIEKCRQAREVATTIDWPCDIQTRFLDNNIGCDSNVSSAINWFFQNVEYGIIFEDDCIVHQHFFDFCGELLARFCDDKRIMQISSISPYLPRDYPYDYHFSRAFRCGGGWSTWRRAWMYYTSDMSRYNKRDISEILKTYFQDISEYHRQYKKYLEFKKNLFINWDFKWNIACYSQNGLCIVPEKNLMHNIGFDEESTHTKKIDPMFQNLRLQNLQFPIRHPQFVYADMVPEKSLDKIIYDSLRLRSRCMYLLRKVLATVLYFRKILPYG